MPCLRRVSLPMKISASRYSASTCCRRRLGVGAGELEHLVERARLLGGVAERGGDARLRVERLGELLAEDLDAAIQVRGAAADRSASFSSASPARIRRFAISGGSSLRRSRSTTASTASTNCLVWPIRFASSRARSCRSMPRRHHVDRLDQRVERLVAAVELRVERLGHVGEQARLARAARGWSRAASRAPRAAARPRRARAGCGAAGAPRRRTGSPPPSRTRAAPWPDRPRRARPRACAARTAPRSRRPRSRRRPAAVRRTTRSSARYVRSALSSWPAARAISASSFWIAAFDASIFDADSISAIASSILPSACATRASSTCSAARSGERRRPKSLISSPSERARLDELAGDALADRERGAQILVGRIERERGLERGDRLRRASRAWSGRARRPRARTSRASCSSLEQRQAARQVARERLPLLGLAIELGEQRAQLERGLLVVEVDLDRGDRAVGLVRRQVRLRELLHDDQPLAPAARCRASSRATARPARTDRARG